MNRAEILKSLLADYKAAGGDITNIAAATAYLNARKPAGMGRVTAVICEAVNKQTGAPAPAQAPPMTQDAPPAVVEAAPPVVIASQTVTFPEVMRDKPEAVYHEAVATLPEPEYAYGEPPMPPVPYDPPVEKKQPDPVALSSAASEVIIPPKKSLLGRLKFWGKKK